MKCRWFVITTPTITLTEVIGNEQLPCPNARQYLIFLCSCVYPPYNSSYSRCSSILPLPLFLQQKLNILCHVKFRPSIIILQSPQLEKLYRNNSSLENIVESCTEPLGDGIKEFQVGITYYLKVYVMPLFLANVSIFVTDGAFILICVPSMTRHKPGIPIIGKTLFSGSYRVRVKFKADFVLSK